MSKAQILYMKGQQSDPNDFIEFDDEWDDTELIEEYDKTMAKAKEEMARRIKERSGSESLNAFECNTINNAKETLKVRKSKKHKERNHKWKIGSFCRAVYSDDGVEYEAEIVHFLNEDQASVRYLGYDNEEIVQISNLKESLGHHVIAQQVKQAIQDGYDGGNLTSSTRIKPDVKGNFVPKNTGKRKKKKGNSQMFDAYGNGNIPPLFCIPPVNLEGFENFGADFMGLGDFEETNSSNFHRQDSSSDGPLTAMLVSWYLSGYHTGYYKGLNEGKKKRSDFKKH